MNNSINRLYRSRHDRMIAGVCAGLGHFFGIDPTVIRLSVVLVTFFWPFTVLVYLIMMLIVPEEPVAANEPSIIEPPIEPSAQ
ncbi:MAG: PspC domain-containing protein [Anaerolineales bacterium]|nr:PspC domain-containing protein [Anaerolineales bacterium]